MNRGSQAYWNKRAATFTRNATSDYERWLLDLLALEEGEEILEFTPTSNKDDQDDQDGPLGGADSGRAGGAGGSNGGAGAQ